MSHVTRGLRILAVGAALLVALTAGCSKKRGTPFDPDDGHPDDFFAKHADSFQADSGSCVECHGADLRGGIAKVSCYSASRDEQSCHAAGPAGHDTGWSLPGNHGATAKGAATPSSGFASCETCHGTDFKGGTAGESCFPCHGWEAPHAKSGWDSGGSSHQSTDEDNAAVCAQCHQSSSGTPDCFNNTLCHGASGNHPDGWSSGSEHGATAKANPGSSSGFLYCESCHGSGLDGGSANQSCLVNSGCHGWSAPHASSGWEGGGSSHRTTNVGNATVCAQCHTVSAPASGTTCVHNGSCHDD